MRFAVLLLLTGCAGQNYVEVGIGPKVRGPDWQGRGGVVDMAVGREGERTFCEYRHTSNLATGWPWNGEPETTLDRLTCGVRVGW